MSKKVYTYESAMQRIAEELRTSRQEWNHNCIGTIEGIGSISCLFWCTEGEWKGKSGCEIYPEHGSREYKQFCIETDLTQAQAINVAESIDNYYETIKLFGL